jgi:hypothetical protein
VYADTIKKMTKNRNKTGIGPMSVDDEVGLDTKDMMKRKILALVVMWYLPVIDHFSSVFSNPRDA